MLGGTQTQSQIKTKRPKLATVMPSLKIVSIGGTHATNLGKKHCSSQQSGVGAMTSFLRNRQMKTQPSLQPVAQP